MLAFCVQRVHRYWNSDVKAPTPVCVFSVWGVRTCWHCHFDSSWRTGFKDTSGLCQEGGRKEGRSHETNEYFSFNLSNERIPTLLCLVSHVAVLHPERRPRVRLTRRLKWISGGVMMEDARAGSHSPSSCSWRRWSSQPPPLWGLVTNVGQFAFSSPSPGKPSIRAAPRFQTSEKKKKKKTSGRINVLWFDYSGLNSSLHVFSLCLPPLVSQPGRIPACW